MLGNVRRFDHFDHAHKTRDVDSSPMMRAFNPHSSGGADGKPSKLELMRADYQRRLLKEKEEKMVQLYEDNQRKVMTRMVKGGGGSGSRVAQYGATGTGSGKSVRDLVNERRRMEANEISSITSPYRQAKELPSPNEWPGRADRNSTPKKQKASAGRDRSQPLAPIRRPQDTQETGNAPRSGIPQRFSVAPPENGNPFPGRPRLVKHKPLPPTGNHRVDNKSRGGAGDSNSVQSLSSGHKLMTRNSPQVTQNRLEQLQSERLPPRAPEKLTDFQKWQAEQSQAREERLKKVNSLRNANSSNEGVWKNSDDESVDGREYNKDTDHEDRGSVRGKNLDEKMKAKERELVEKIARRQRELDEMKKERDVQGEEEQHNTESRKTKTITERSRNQKLDDERQKEELKRFKQEENETRLEIQKAEKQRKEEEKEWRENEKRTKEENKVKIQPENTKSRRQNEVLAQHRDKLSSKSEHGRNSRSFFEEDSPQPAAKPSGSAPKISKNPQPSKSRTESNDLDERRLSLSDAHVYEQAAVSLDAQGFVADLATCTICGRSFLQERLKKHQEACAKAHKPRKEFDSAKKRVEGTDLAKYAGKAKRREPPKRKSNWRAKHQEFIQTLRHAKKVTQCEMEGGDLRNLTPPPASVNPDYVPCPHCGRTFNETAAERHIPRCRDLKTRPPPAKGKRR